MLTESQEYNFLTLFLYLRFKPDTIPLRIALRRELSRMFGKYPLDGDEIGKEKNAGWWWCPG